jgi:hypothetical protein
MMKSAPASTFVMSQSQFLLQLFIIPFDDPAVLREFDHELGIRRESGKPVLGWFFCHYKKNRIANG